jgi:RNA polymerase sigma-70 factor (ECF subfamily)
MSVPVEDVVACMPNLKRFARRLTRSEDAEDLVQETVTRALGSLDRYQPTGDLMAWLFAIMKNHVRDQWRKQRNMTTVSLGPTAEIETSYRVAPQIERLLMRDLASAIDRLPGDQRAVLIQVSIDPSSYQAASAALGIPIGTVRSRLFRARSALHRMLEEPTAGRGNRAMNRQRLN